MEQKLQSGQSQGTKQGGIGVGNVRQRLNLIYGEDATFTIGNRPEGGVMVCANHSSMLDPLLIAVAFGRNEHLRFMAKKELFTVPVVGKLITGAEAFPVDRGNNDLSAIRTALRFLKSGCKVMLFPEGTRVSADDAVAAKNGAISLASRTGVPVVPVYLGREKRLFRKTELVIGEPYLLGRIPREEYEMRAGELMDKIYELGTETV